MMSKFQQKTQEIIECPVCGQIPRNFPVVACSAGHIVCGECKKDEKISICPSCRRQLNCTNTLVGYIAMMCEHKCMYHVFGCDFKSKIDEISQHERTCVNRTIVCPFKDCGRDIELRNYEKHALLKECAINLNVMDELINVNIYEGHSV